MSKKQSLFLKELSLLMEKYEVDMVLDCYNHIPSVTFKGNDPEKMIQEIDVEFEGEDYEYKFDADDVLKKRR